MGPILHHVQISDFVIDFKPEAQQGQHAENDDSKFV
jgi:hypothetical protein